MYDFESMLVPDNQQGGSQTTMLSKHHPISVSVCSTLSRSPECQVSEKAEGLGLLHHEGSIVKGIYKLEEDYWKSQ